MRSPVILQVIGYSGSGKTTLIEKLLSVLKNKNLSTFVLKSAKSHPYVYSDKDSDRFLESGAQSSAVFFKDYTQITIQDKLDVETVIGLLRELKQHDLIILEGFKGLSFPKILVWANEIPDSEILDYTTIRYLYLSKEVEDIENSILGEKLDLSQIMLTNNVEELATRIILDLDIG